MRLAVASHNAGHTEVVVLAALGATAVMVACGGSNPDHCDLDRDCPSGFCRADHSCAPDVPDAAGDAAVAGDGPLGCTPDHDGTVTRSELVMAAGQIATFRIATDVTVDTAGTQDAGGHRTWSFAAAASGDHDVAVTLLAPAGQWWAADFSGATYANPLSADNALLGVMRLDASGLALLGVVSPEAGLYRTELTYDPPVPLIPTPLGPSAQWTVTSTVSGVASGVTSLYTERYQSRVDAIGDVATPYGTFPVRRIAVDLTRTIGAAVVTRKTFSFVAECYGTVATVASQDYETTAEFTSAAELWRLTP